MLRCIFLSNLWRFYLMLEETVLTFFQFTRHTFSLKLILYRKQTPDNLKSSCLSKTVTWKYNNLEVNVHPENKGFHACMQQVKIFVDFLSLYVYLSNILVLSCNLYNSHIYSVSLLAVTFLIFYNCLIINLIY